VLAHGKAQEKSDGKPEDRPESNVAPIPGAKGKVLLIRRFQHAVHGFSSDLKLFPVAGALWHFLAEE
jgi:hypothetical protein